MQINYRKVKEPEFTNDLCGGPSFYPDHHNAREWIGVYEPEDLLNKMNTPEFNTYAKLPDKKEQLNSLLKIIKEDDNPILFIVKLK